MLLLAFVLACATDPGTLATRPTAEVCEDRVAPEEPACEANYAEDSDCSVHADCADGDEGTCLRGGSYGLWCLCAYDQCHTDDDCGATAVCGCASDPAVQRPTNTCLAADCRVDADCPSGRCQADHGPWCGNAGADDTLPIRGWHCASAADTCNGDEDCDVAGGDRCIFYEEHFQCSNVYAQTCD